jgi:sarcosine oxidase subunit gamma
MAEPAVHHVLHRSPLDGFADRFAAVSAARGTGGTGLIRLAEVPFLAQVNLRLDAGGPAADAVGAALGGPLPVQPGTSMRSGDRSVLWLGPDEWLVVGAPGTEQELMARLSSAVGAQPASIVDTSAARTTLLVAGRRAADLLSHGCALDLHPRAFPVGACVQTMLARAQIVLVNLGAEPSYRVLVRASYAGYLADWLLDAASEYTY